MGQTSNGCSKNARDAFRDHPLHPLALLFAVAALAPTNWHQGQELAAKEAEANKIDDH
jgi:hypothetical protein